MKITMQRIILLIIVQIRICKCLKAGRKHKAYPKAFAPFKGVSTCGSFLSDRLSVSCLLSNLSMQVSVDSEASCLAPSQRNSATSSLLPEQVALLEGSNAERFYYWTTKYRAFFFGVDTAWDVYLWKRLVDTSQRFLSSVKKISHKGPFSVPRP